MVDCTVANQSPKVIVGRKPITGWLLHLGFRTCRSHTVLYKSQRPEFPVKTAIKNKLFIFQHQGKKTENICLTESSTEASITKYTFFSIQCVHLFP